MSVNQSKLEVVKQEMARVNIVILGISKPKWTGMGEFNSNAHYIYYCGQESLRRNEVALIVNKRVQNAVLGCNLKNGRMISVRFQGKPSSSVQFRCSVCPTLCASMYCSTPGLPVSITNSQSLLKLISSHWWCHPTISSSVIPFSSSLQSFPASGSFLMSQFFASSGQSIGVSASASVLPINIQDWFL